MPVNKNCFISITGNKGEIITGFCQKYGERRFHLNHEFSSSRMLGPGMCGPPTEFIVRLYMAFIRLTGFHTGYHHGKHALGVVHDGCIYRTIQNKLINGHSILLPLRAVREIFREICNIPHIGTPKTPRKCHCRMHLVTPRLSPFPVLRYGRAVIQRKISQ